VSRLEAGQRTPSLEILRELARRVGVSEAYLATGDETPFAAETQEFLDADIALRLGETDLADELFHAILEQASTRPERGRALAGLGQVAFRRGDTRGAIDRFEEALALTEATPSDLPALADSLGRAYAMVGELGRAVTLFRACVEAAEARGDRIETVRFAVLLTNALEDLGAFDETATVLARIAPLVEDAHDPILRARFLWAQSRLHTLDNDPEPAARYARKALEILELTEHTHYTAQAHQLLAHIELDAGRPAEALELLQRGWQLSGDMGNQVEQAQFRLEEARALAGLGRSKEAAALAMEIAAVIADAAPRDAGRAYTVLGDVFRQVGEPERARELYELAAEVLQENPNRYLAEVYYRLAELLEEEGRKDEALVLLKEAVRIPHRPVRRTAGSAD